MDGWMDGLASFGIFLLCLKGSVAKFYQFCKPLCGVSSGVVCWGTVPQAWRLQVQLEFFIDLIFLATVWPWGWLSF